MNYLFHSSHPRNKNKAYAFFKAGFIESWGRGYLKIQDEPETDYTPRYLHWTEDNRLHTVADERHYSYYAYDFAGERTVKLTGVNSVSDINAETMTTFALLDNPTLYPSSYLVLGTHGYTKHYYAGTERVCAKIGGGFGAPITSFDPDEAAVADSLFNKTQSNVTSQSYPVNNVNEINTSRPELSIPIMGNPTRLNASVYIELTPIHDVVEFEESRWDSEDEVFYYHSDHLGSASWITDGLGVTVQHLQYLPFGEPFVNQRAAGSLYDERFTFTGKAPRKGMRIPLNKIKYNEQRDEETGFSYFGARYMDHELMTMWLSVDPMSDKYPNTSPYVYCALNPVKLVDPDGEEFIGAIIGAAIGFTSVIISQTVTHGLQNVEKGEGFFNGWKQNIDWADVAVSTVCGITNGFAPGTGTYVGRVAGDILKAGVDWNPGNEDDKINHVFNGSKSWKVAGVDLITNLCSDFGGDFITSDLKKTVISGKTIYQACSAKNLLEGVAIGCGIGSIQAFMPNTFLSTFGQIVKTHWFKTHITIDPLSHRAQDENGNWGKWVYDQKK